MSWHRSIVCSPISSTYVVPFIDRRRNRRWYRWMKIIYRCLRSGSTMFGFCRCAVLGWLVMRDRSSSFRCGFKTSKSCIAIYIGPTPYIPYPGCSCLTWIHGWILYRSKMYNRYFCYCELTSRIILYNNSSK